MNTARNRYQDTVLTSQACVTEIIIPQTGNSTQIIFPLVASMSHNNPSKKQSQETRWLTWLTDRKPTLAQLESYNVMSDAIRLIHIDRNNDNRWLLWEALSKGNSHTVIADIEHIHNEDILAMEAAAQQGQATGILVRSL